MSTPFSFSIVVYLNVSFGILYREDNGRMFREDIFRTRGTINLEFAIRMCARVISVVCNLNSGAKRAHVARKPIT